MGDLSPTLYDVRWNRQRGIDHLLPDTAVARPAYFARDTMCLERPLMILLPVFEILEITHAMTMLCGSEETHTSYRRKSSFRRIRFSWRLTRRLRPRLLRAGTYRSAVDGPR